MPRQSQAQPEPKPQEQTAVDRNFMPTAPFSESFSTWSETKLSYPREVFKGEYYRLTGSAEDHYKLLRNGWIDERAEDHPYKPWTSSPESLEVARLGLLRLQEEKDRELSAKTPQVTKDLVAEMIEKKFAESMGR